jgi:hypothetical protein
VLAVSKIMRLNSIISDGKRISLQVYPFSAFLTQVFYCIYKYVIVHNVQWISVRRCWINENEVFILYRNW